MRSCAYCGKELEKGEKCTCPQSAARRSQSSENNYSYTNTQQNQQTNNSYQTGYTKRENPIKHAWEKHRAKRNARVKRGNAGIWDDMWLSIVNTIKSPVLSISNPRYISHAAIILLAMLQGALIWLCMYFLRTGVVRSPFGIMMSIITVNPAKMHSFYWMIMTTISGAFGGIIFFLLYSGVFYMLNRYIFRRRTGFWNFSQRMILTPIPFTLICLIGCVFGLISSTTLAIMIICGIISMVVLTYEALKSEWASQSSGRIMYNMMFGFFIIVFIVCYLIRLS